MKCPHCGSDMPKEHVFCEKCGKERLLVPVFEPEIEDSVAESMSTIVQELSPEIQSNTDDTDKSDKKESVKEIERQINKGTDSGRGSQQIHFLISAVIAMIIFIAVFSIFFFVYTESSFEYQYQRAQNAYEKGQFNEALEIVDKCLTIEPDSIDVRLLRIQVYQEQGRTEEVIAKCQSLIERAPDDRNAYDILLPIYIHQQEYQKVAGVLAKCPVTAINEKYADYMAASPEFDQEEGVYTSSISLKLIAGGNGTIYYTLDGTTPSKYSDRYTAPIKLISGTYTVSAVYINEYGICSEVVSKMYDVESNIEFVPEISAPSGNYAIPQSIVVSVPDEEFTVYYTTDGTEPTLDSNIYSTAFPMPLGESTFRFLMVDMDGNESEIITRNYNCIPTSVYTVEQACIMLKQNLIVRGEILDVNGTLPGTTDRKEYVCDSVATTDGVVYYVIYEYIHNTSGTMIRSGNAYAFSLIDGQIKRASFTENGYLSLSDF